jgi:hypothetical protein
MVKG